MAMMHSGGLAQMAYSPENNLEPVLGLQPGGFSNHRTGQQRGALLGRRSNAHSPTEIQVSAPNKAVMQDQPLTPRTSRAYMLAGLRTASRSHSAAISNHSTPCGLDPRSSPAHRGHLPSNSVQPQQASFVAPSVRHGSSFSGIENRNMNHSMHNRHSSYGIPEVLAPPALRLQDESGLRSMDPEVYADLIASGQYLAQQQMLLQQQLDELTLAQKHLQGLSLAANNRTVQHVGQNHNQQHAMPQEFLHAHGDAQPSHSLYQQQLQQGLQPVVTPVTGSPGVFMVFNPLTGQTNYVMESDTDPGSAILLSGAGTNTGPGIDQNFLHPSQSPPVPQLAHSPPPGTPTFQAHVSPPPESNAPVRIYRSPSPSRMTAEAATEVLPLPPPSSNAFRRGHSKRASSMSGVKANLFNAAATGIHINHDPQSYSQKEETAPNHYSPSASGSSALASQSSSAGQGNGSHVFGPGQARIGDHPIRQPRGPPSMEELAARPTSKYDGAKNFAGQHRRHVSQALNNVVRAGMERRGLSVGDNVLEHATPFEMQAGSIKSHEGREHDRDLGLAALPSPFHA